MDETERALRALSDKIAARFKYFINEKQLTEVITTELLPLFKAGIVGAYAAAAKHLEARASELEAGANNYPNFKYSGSDPFAKERHSCVLECRVQAKAILALTPADARHASLGWRCFFCDEVFTDKALAEEHFGSDEHEVSIPACIDPLRTDEKKRHREVYAMRQEIKRVEGERDEFEIDSDNLHAMQNELERLFGDGVTTAHHAWLRLEAAQNLAEAYREKLDTQPAAIASAEARARLEEAKWWHGQIDHICVRKGPAALKGCQRILQLEATPDSTKERQG